MKKQEGKEEGKAATEEGKAATPLSKRSQKARPSTAGLEEMMKRALAVPQKVPAVAPTAPAAAPAPTLRIEDTGEPLEDVRARLAVRGKWGNACVAAEFSESIAGPVNLTAAVK